MHVKRLAGHLVHKGTWYRLVIVLSICPGTQGDYCLETCQEKVCSYTSFNRGRRMYLHQEKFDQKLRKQSPSFYYKHSAPPPLWTSPEGMPTSMAGEPSGWDRYRSDHQQHKRGQIKAAKSQAGNRHEIWINHKEKMWPLRDSARRKEVRAPTVCLGWGLRASGLPLAWFLHPASLDWLRL